MSADRTFRPIADRRPWTAADDAIIAREYPDHGSSACIALMPWRTVAACHVRARKLGIKRVTFGRGATVHIPDSDVDALIRKFYARPVKKNTLRPFAASINRPHWYVKRRAEQLGVIVPRIREPGWSPREIEFLEEWAGLTPTTIRKKLSKQGYKRTVTAIILKRKRLGMSARDERELSGLYTAAGVGRMLGTHTTTVLRWIRMSQLTAKRRRDDGAEHTEWDVTRDSLRRFLATYPQSVDLRMVDRDLFMDLAFGDCI